MELAASALRLAEKELGLVYNQQPDSKNEGLVARVANAVYNFFAKIISCIVNNWGQLKDRLNGSYNSKLEVVKLLKDIPQEEVSKILSIISPSMSEEDKTQFASAENRYPLISKALESLCSLSMLRVIAGRPKQDRAAFINAAVELISPNMNVNNRYSVIHDLRYFPSEIRGDVVECAKQLMETHTSILSHHILGCYFSYCLTNPDDLYTLDLEGDPVEGDPNISIDQIKAHTDLTLRVVRKIAMYQTQGDENWELATLLRTISQLRCSLDEKAEIVTQALERAQSQAVDQIKAHANLTLQVARKIAMYQTPKELTTLFRTISQSHERTQSQIIGVMQITERINEAQRKLQKPKIPT